MLEPVEQLVYN